MLFVTTIVKIYGYNILYYIKIFKYIFDIYLSTNLTCLNVFSVNVVIDKIYPLIGDMHHIIDIIFYISIWEFRQMSKSECIRSFVEIIFWRNKNNIVLDVFETNQHHMI